eukprot:6209504-Pleurochrysis_carterae.AAC.2
MSCTDVRFDASVTLSRGQVEVAGSPHRQSHAAEHDEHPPHTDDLRLAVIACALCSLDVRLNRDRVTSVTSSPRRHTAHNTLVDDSFVELSF